MLLRILVQNTFLTKYCQSKTSNGTFSKRNSQLIYNLTTAEKGLGKSLNHDLEQ